MLDNRNNPIPFWLGGILVALILIVVGTRVGGGGANPRLTQEFAPRPTDPNAPTPQPFELPKVELPDLPPDVQRSLTDLRSRLEGGETVPALTPVAANPQVRVEVQQVRRNGDKVQVDGSISNVASTTLSVPTTAFSFRDSAGITYAMTGSGTTTLTPGQSTKLNLSVPLPRERGLTLILNLPPEPPLEQVLVVETRS